MSLNITYQVTKMDNCDQKTTILTCKNEAGATVEVEVDPVAIWENMIENCFDPENPKDNLDTSVLDAMNDLINDLLYHN